MRVAASQGGMSAETETRGQPQGHLNRMAVGESPLRITLSSSAYPRKQSDTTRMAQLSQSTLSAASATEGNTEESVAPSRVRTPPVMPGVAAALGQYYPCPIYQATTNSNEMKQNKKN